MLKKDMEYHMGECVLCDLCNKDYTGLKDTGGIIFSGKAICPVCTPGALAGAKRYNEEQYIEERCREGESFQEMVIRYRGNNDSVTVYSFGKIEDIKDLMGWRLK